MAARSRSGNKSSAPSAGRLATVFGLGTIVLLLGVGWILVHGGLGEVPGKEVLRSLLSGEAGEKVAPEELQATIDRLQKRISELEENHRKEIATLTDRYEQRIDELRLQIKLLQDENERLQRSSDK